MQLEMQDSRPAGTTSERANEKGFMFIIESEKTEGILYPDSGPD